MNNHNGIINHSYVGQLIMKLSHTNNQTAQMKKNINTTINTSGHGCILLGSSSRLEGGVKNIRMLVGTHNSRDGELKFGTFGGKSNHNEMTVDTMIRETIEEVFNFKVSHNVIHNIRDFLNINTNLYYIYQVSKTTMSYSYIFDVSILGEFIKIITEYYRPRNTAFFIPIKSGLSNIHSYLDANVKYSDLSSFSGTHAKYSRNSTIKLVEFMKKRVITYGFFRYLGIKPSSGLNEIKYISFPSLSKLMQSAERGSYNLFNFNKMKRENLKMNSFFIKLLNKDILKTITSMSIDNDKILLNVSTESFENTNINININLLILFIIMLLILNIIL